jgi:hypothetical protein
MQIFYKDYDVLEKSGYIPDRWCRIDPGNWSKNIDSTFLHVEIYDESVSGLKIYFFDGQGHVRLGLEKYDNETLQELEARLLKTAKLLGWRKGEA